MTLNVVAEYVLPKDILYETMNSRYAYYYQKNRVVVTYFNGMGM